MDGKIRHPARSVAADTAAAETLHTKYEVMEEGPTRARTDSSAFFRGVISSGYGGQAGALGVAGHKLHAGEDAVGKPVSQAYDFIVPEARIEGDLGDDIGCGIEGVGSIDTIVATAGSSRAHQKVAGIARRGQGSFRILDREGNRNLVAEVLGYAEAPLARKIETNVVIRVDGLRPSVVGFAHVIVNRDSLSIFGEQTPGLAGKEAKAAIKLDLCPCLADTQGVAVGLGRSRGCASRKEVGRQVTGEIDIAHSAVDKNSGLGLAGGAEEFRDLALRGARHREAVKGCVEVRAEGPVAAHKRSFGISARRDVDAPEPNRDGTLHLFVVVPGLGVG